MLAQKVVPKKKLALPTSYKLGDLFEYVNGHHIGNNTHCALVDVRATSAVLRYSEFWSERKGHVFCFQECQMPSNGGADSDLESESTDSSDADEDGLVAQESIEEGPIQSLGWFVDSAFNGCDCKSRFEEVFAKQNTRQVVGDKTGLQCSPVSINSPPKPWQQIFIHALLDKVVGYTNEYGEQTCKDWSLVNRQDLVDFVSILFLST